MISAKNVVKKFGGNVAVNSISLKVARGEIFGLLGPNAAGKTTFIRMLCGILDSDGGEITVAGKSVQSAKHQFGYVAQYFGQYEELSVWENVRFYAEIYGVNDLSWIERLLLDYGLDSYKHKLARTLSGGYKRRLALVCALVHDPDVLILDEPTAGIDPTTRKMLWDEFYNLSAQGKTLFVATHYMEEAQRCHQLAFMSSGDVVATGTPDSIKQALGDAQIFAGDISFNPKLRDTLSSTPGVELVNQFGTQLRVLCKASVNLSEIQSIVEPFAPTIKLKPTSANLEDVFIVLTNPQAEAQR